MAATLTWHEMLSGLPSVDAEQPIEAQARSVLRLLDRPGDADELPFDPSLCPNCGGESLSLRSPYCSVPCREHASFVRQFRQGLREGASADPERQVALGQNLWKLLGGGFPLRNTLIPPKAMVRALAQTDFKCSKCGGVATTVDHIGSACNRTINLRPMCEACAVTRPFHDIKVIQDGQSLLDEFAGRIHADRPLRACDDAGTWDWRDAIEQRKSLT